MRVLLDECVNPRVKEAFPQHEVQTVKGMGWGGFTNGKLMSLAQQSFDVCCQNSGCRAKNGTHGHSTMNDQPVQPADFVTLYHQAFEQFGALALWSSKPVADPTPADALAITHSLRVEGNLQARRLAEQIEQACRAAV
jgi:hypothetical protein